ncbi:MAG: methyltransferase domain-containing protein [bacterium]|nr:methyltransferase domain-containing protein [bacterium]
MSQLEFDENVARALERMYMTPDVVGQRSDFLRAVALREGERALDVGVGPGLLVHDMAKIVGEKGRVAGVDASDAMVGISENRCADMPWTDYHKADATSLPFDDASFDVVTSSQVYEYVADMETALAEVHRVLRPGGRVFILDTDWDSVVWQTRDRARMRRVMDAWDGHLHDPHLPARLGALLEAAGLQVTHREAIPIVNPSLHSHCYSFGILAAIQGFVAGSGEVNSDEAQAWADELRALGESGEYFFSINRYVFGALRAG